jgi:hypothetical protein
MTVAVEVAASMGQTIFPELGLVMMDNPEQAPIISKDLRPR